MTSTDQTDLATAIGAALPYLRRYARALTGNQETGDRYAAATLEALLVELVRPIEASSDPKVALFHAFHLVWASAGAPVGEADTALSARAQSHMSLLTPNSREALLLHVIERFRFDEIAGNHADRHGRGAELVHMAMQEMEQAVAGRVMIIEDEAIIAMDIVDIVSQIGHSVTGIARTRDEAVALALARTPGPDPADIQLADNSSGIDAVNDILRQFEDLPVIFITAFPERLLTGERPEPAFLITKPYSEEQVRSAVSQAMFFASTETLASAESEVSASH